MEINGVPIKDPNAKGTSVASKSLAENFDTFLTLLTQQLKHQDPLDPMDSNQFTQQLVQFAGVEQAIDTNKKLDNLLAFQRTGLLNSAVSYIGKWAEVVSDQLMLKDASATISYGLDGNAAQTTINFYDKNGGVVRSVTGETGSGRHEFVWDGRSASGRQLEDGVYSFSVIALDNDGKPIDVLTGSLGKVTGVEIVDETVMLNMDDLGVPFDKVFAVRQEETKP